MRRRDSLSRLLNIYWHYAIARRSRCSYPPYRLWVEPTSLCNLKCPMCPNQSLPSSQRGLMDMDLFCRVIDQAAGFLHDINVHHRGESLLHPQLTDMIAYAVSRGIFTKLHTNATLLDESKSHALIRSGLDLISFSFDGTDAQTYERYRKGASFADTVENILNFLKLKKKLQASKPAAILEMMDLSGVDSRYRLEGKEVFRRRFDGLPLDRLVVKKPHNFGGSVRLSTGRDPGRPALTPCTIPWHSLVVFWNGEVAPCPQDFFGRLVVGTVAESRLVELFHGPEMVSLRESMLRREISPQSPCASCDLIRRGTILGIPVGSWNYWRR